MEPSIIQELGWIWLVHPREGVNPLTLLESDEKGVIKRIVERVFKRDSKEIATALNFDIFALFPKKGAGKKPKISKPMEVASFKGHDILSVQAGVTLKTVEGLSGIGSAAAISNLKVADKLLFSFENVERFYADNEILLEKYIRVTKPDKDAESYIKKLQNGQIYVVTEVLTTTAFEIRNASEFQISGKLEADAVSKFAKLKIENEVKTDSDSLISYKKYKPVTFALKASKILYNKDKNTFSISKKPLKVVRSGNKIEAELLQTENGMLDIE